MKDIIGRQTEMIRLSEYVNSGKAEFVVVLS